MRRLRPPAYLDDEEADAAYQLLAGEELRTSRQEAIASVIGSLGQSRLTEEEVWSWMQAINALRLVVGTGLDISDDDHGPPPIESLSAEERMLWGVYELTTMLQYDLVVALRS